VLQVVARFGTIIIGRRIVFGLLHERGRRTGGGRKHIWEAE
jgi:hypothetical protein